MKCRAWGKNTTGLSFWKLPKSDSAKKAKKEWDEEIIRKFIVCIVDIFVSIFFLFLIFQFSKFLESVKGVRLKLIEGKIKGIIKECEKMDADKERNKINYKFWYK